MASELHCRFPIEMTLVVPLTTRDRGLPHHVPVTSAEAGFGGGAVGAAVGGVAEHARGLLPELDVVGEQQLLHRAAASVAWAVRNSVRSRGGRPATRATVSVTRSSEPAAMPVSSAARKAAKPVG